MGEYAQDSHTTVSVLGIEGSDCAMQHLSSCAAITSGTVNILHPLEMVRQIRLISQNPTLATDVEVVYLMPPVVSAVGRESEAAQVTKVTEWVGNATRETDVSLHFSLDGKKLKNVTSVPFQVRIYIICPTTQQHNNEMGFWFESNLGQLSFVLGLVDIHLPYIS